MPFFAVLVALLLFSGPAFACEVGEPFPWKTSDYCSPAAQRLMERIGSCLDLLGKDAVTKKQIAANTKAMKALQCDRLVCDYDAAARSDHEAVADYIDRQFTDEPEFRLTFPPVKSCKPPVIKKKTPVKKPVVKSKGKQPIKSSSGMTVKSKSAPPPKPVNKKPVKKK